MTKRVWLLLLVFGGAFLALAQAAQAQVCTPWQVHPGRGIIRFGGKAPYPGWERAYDVATVPAADAAGWRPAPDPAKIDFEAPSIHRGAKTAGLGADFTYFQAFVIPPPACRLRVRGVDAGVRVSVQNSRYPGGKVLTRFRKNFGPLAGGGDGVAELTRWLVPGDANRIILTLADDFGPDTALPFARIEWDDQPAPIGQPNDQLVERIVELQRLHLQRVQRGDQPARAGETVPDLNREQALILAWNRQQVIALRIAQVQAAEACLIQMQLAQVQAAQMSRMQRGLVFRPPQTQVLRQPRQVVLTRLTPVPAVRAPILVRGKAAPSPSSSIASKAPGGNRGGTTTVTTVSTQSSSGGSDGGDGGD